MCVCKWNVEGCKLDLCIGHTVCLVATEYPLGVVNEVQALVNTTYKSSIEREIRSLYEFRGN